MNIPQGKYFPCGNYFIKNPTSYIFIIDDDVDEINVIRKCHQEAVHSKDYFLIILPTLNCNFKCWYCIQEHIPSVMNPETFETLKRHIDYMIEEEKISSLHIDWFGGEPFMYFKKIIEPLSRYAIQKCEQHNIPFMNSATTNGYFINSDVSSLLTDLKFKQFQITLDGEKVFHDKVKFMKDAHLPLNMFSRTSIICWLKTITFVFY